MGAKLEPELKAVGPAGPERVTSLLVKGMTCSGCARRVTDAVQAVDGVESATVDLEPGSVRVRWRSGTAPEENAIVQAVRHAGYEPQLPVAPKSQLSVAGMTCSGCARKVADSLRSVPGVKSVDVQLDSGRAEVQWQPRVSPDEDGLVEAVTKAGF